MARARNIKPGMYKNEDLAECSIWARYIWPGLWMVADREGRFEDRPKRIKGELLPFDTVDIDPLLQELASFGFIVRYEVAGKRYVQIINFRKHQSPHYLEAASTIPAPPLTLVPGIAPSSSDSIPRITPSSSTPESENPSLMKGGSKPPDSLIPDSLIPDSLIPESRATAKAPNPGPGMKATRAGAIAAKLRVAGVQITAMHPVTLELVDLGATDEQLTEAVDRARQQKPPPTPIPAKYLLPIVKDVISPPPSAPAKERKPTDVWWTTPQGIDRKARELGIFANQSDSYDTLKQKCFDRLKSKGNDQGGVAA